MTCPSGVCRILLFSQVLEGETLTFRGRGRAENKQVAWTTGFVLRVSSLSAGGHSRVLGTAASGSIMDCLLTHGYFLGEDPKELQIMKPYAPLGILYLASHLRARHFSVEVFEPRSLPGRSWKNSWPAEPPSVLGVYANLMTRGSVVRILRAARQMGWKTVVGGPEPGAYAEEYLAAGADAVVMGEGELTMEELLPVLQRGSMTIWPGAGHRLPRRRRPGAIHRAAAADCRP